MNMFPVVVSSIAQSGNNICDLGPLIESEPHKTTVVGELHGTYD